MEHSKQLNLPFNKHNKQYNEHDYIVTDGNRNAFEYFINRAEWPTFCSILYGPNGSGKTHLATIWQEHNKAYMLSKPKQNMVLRRPCVIENIDKIRNHLELLHCFNLSNEYRHKLLLTSSTLPHYMKIELPDLHSRLQASPIIMLSNPDDQLLNIILLKQFVERHIKVKPAVLRYILSHCKRSVPMIKKLVESIDKYALQINSNITINIVKQVLDNIENQQNSKILNRGILQRSCCLCN